MIKKRILLFTDWYEPGFKAGGPIKSCVNFVAQMREEYEIFIFTSDRDRDDKIPYSSIVGDLWISKLQNVKVFYASPRSLSFKSINQQVKSINPDYLYLNSMFSLKFSIFPIVSTAIKKKLKIILAPRGMLKDSALQFKFLKKRIFLSIFGLLRISSKIRFHATDLAEVAEIKRYFGSETRVEFIPNFSGEVEPLTAHLEKVSGQLRIAFIGRIHPIKNLLYLIECLMNVHGMITLDFAGNIEDESYFRQCIVKAKELNPSIKVNYQGSIPPCQIEEFLQNHHILALPTSGENFGHSIFESLSKGKPVVISNNTPWKNLEKIKAGFDISLSKPDEFSKAIQYFIDMNNEEYKKWSKAAWEFASKKNDNKQLKKKYIQLFS